MDVQHVCLPLNARASARFVALTEYLVCIVDDLFIVVLRQQHWQCECCC